MTRDAGHMKSPSFRRLMCCGFRAILVLLALAPAVRAHDFEVLVFTKTSGFRHDSIPAAIAVIQQLGAAHDFGVVPTEDAAQINEANLAQFAAVIFVHTTGDFLNAAQETALLQYVENGGGFVGVHAAADAEYNSPPYGQLIGAYFQHHPNIQQATVLALDRSHPSTSVVPERWVRTDEWYSYNINPRGSVHVLATLDESTYVGGQMGHDHPIAWCQEIGDGRSWYTGLGHTVESWSEPLFRAHLLGGIEWAAGRRFGDAGGTVYSRFQKVVLDDDVTDPMSLEVASDGRVFFVERGGRVKIYSPVTGATTVAGLLPAFTGLEDGLLGLALDPAFAVNGWVYLYYSPAGATPENVLSRFTIANDALVPGSEVVLLRVPTQRLECCHSGGGIEFGPNGDLFLSIGDNTNPYNSDGFAPIDERAGRSAWDAQATSANTNDLRGKILRIHPEPNGTYTIPAGNLFAPGTAQTRPEIFVMGARNPFRIAVDPVTGNLYWGDVGPDAPNDSASRGPRGCDELNQALSAGNYGWPYFVANNLAYRDYDFATGGSGATFNPASPVNNSPNNSGAQNLPAARSAFLWYASDSSTAFPAIRAGSGRTMMVGTFYKHDPGTTSDVAFPAYFDRTLFLMEWSRNHLYEVKTDASAGLLKVADFAPTIPVTRPIDLTFGPDGAMYLLEWGSGFGGNNTDARLSKIIYNSGNKAPVARLTADRTDGPVPLTVQFSSAGSSDPDGDEPLNFAWDFDLDGTIDSTAPNPVHTYSSGGLYTARLRVTDSRGGIGIANIEISAGNSRPVVTFTWPPDGAFFDWGDEVGWDLRVDDAEDGSTVTGGIAPDAVTVDVLLGHASHAHGIAQVNGVTGRAIAANSHSFGDNLCFAFDAAYTDRGVPGVAPALGRGTVTLQPKVLQAEHHTTASGVAAAVTSDPVGGGMDVNAIDHGDSISFSPVNLMNIGEVGVRLASTLSGGRIEVHADAPSGPLLATVPVPDTGGAAVYRDAFAPIIDPGGSRELFFVFLRNPGETNLCRVNWLVFRGAGATVTAKGPRVLQISAGRPADSLTVFFDAIMDLASLQTVTNYTLSGASIVSATASADQKSVILTTAAPFTPNQPYVLAVHGVRDLAGDVVAPATRVPFKPQSVVLAINAGGGACTAADGTNYLADQFFTGGNPLIYGNAIAGTTDDPVYQSERWGNFSYSIPIQNGSYLLTLQFAETYWNGNNQRVFSAFAEGQPVVTDLDIHALVGANTALDRAVPVTIADGTLNLTFTVTVDNPKLSGIVVARSPVPFTDFASWQTFYFGSPAAPGAAAGDDAEGDGQSNALEFALGGDPKIADHESLAPTVSITEGNPPKLTLSYRKAAPALAYQVRWSSTLAPASWSAAGVEAEVYFSPTDTWQRSVPILPGDARKFLRLEIGP